MAVQISSSRTGSAIRLYPWKDELEVLLSLLRDDGSEPIKTVYVLFQPEAEDPGLPMKEEDSLALFDALANELPKLESVIVKLEASSSTTRSMLASQRAAGLFSLFKSEIAVAIPPIAALTSLLRGENKMKYLTLIGLNLLGDDFDVNGLTEAVRIHRGLHSFVMKNCWFSTDNQLQLLRSALGERKDMKHCDLLENAEQPTRPRTALAAVCRIVLLSGILVAAISILIASQQKDVDNEYNILSLFSSFQWQAQLDEPVVEQKQKVLGKIFNKLGRK